MLCVVAPVFHNQEEPAPAVNITEPPVHNAVEPPGVIALDGKAFTVTTVGVEVDEQPLALVMVTL